MAAKKKSVIVPFERPDTTPQWIWDGFLAARREMGMTNEPIPGTWQPWWDMYQRGVKAGADIIIKRTLDAGLPIR